MRLSGWQRLGVVPLGLWWTVCVAAYVFGGKLMREARADLEGSGIPINPVDPNATPAMNHTYGAGQELQAFGLYGGIALPTLVCLLIWIVAGFRRQGS